MASVHKIVLPGGGTLQNVKSVKFHEVTNSGVDLRPGCVSSSYIEVVVYGSQEDAVNVGDRLTYYTVNSAGNQTLIGRFFAEPTVRSKSTWGFTAHDSLLNLDADFSEWLANHQEDFPMTVKDVVSAACSVAGVTLSTSSWTNSSMTVQAFYATGVTCRDILSYAAEIGGYFVRANSSGNIVFDWYNAILRDEIYPTSGTVPFPGSGKRIAYKQNGLSYANYQTAALDGVAVFPSGTDDAAYIKPDGATGNIMEIKNNLLLTGADATFYNAVANAVYNACRDVAVYTPGTVSLFPKESPFRAGQRVLVTDIQGVSLYMPLMSLTLSDASADFEATGSEKLTGDSEAYRKSIIQLAADVVRINRLKVDWASIDQAIINTIEANELKSSDFVPANDGIFAETGMGIDLANKNIKAEQFAVDDDGKLYASSADLGGVSFSQTRIYNTLVHNASGTQDDYSLYGNITYRTLVSIGINGLTRETVDALFEYYDNGTLVSSVEVSDCPVVGFKIPLYRGIADSVVVGLKLLSGETATISTRNVIASTPQMYVPSGGQAEFESGITINGVFVNGTFLNSLLKFKSVTVPANGSESVSVTSGTRGVILFSSVGENARGLYFFSCDSSGTVKVTNGIAGSSLTLTPNTQSISIASTSAFNTYGIVIKF